MKSATSLTPPSTSMLNTKCVGVIDPEGPEKYNKTEMKSGRLFTADTQHLTPAVVNNKNSGEKSKVHVCQIPLVCL